MRNFVIYLWAKGWIFIFAIGAVVTVFSGYSLKGKLISLGVVSLLALAAAILGYLRDRSRIQLMTKRKSILRAGEELLSFDSVDLTRPLVGIIAEGAWDGRYVSITIVGAESGHVGNYVVARKWWPYWLLAAGYELTFQELKNEMKSLHVKVLPQDDYSDAVWRRIFG